MTVASVFIPDGFATAMQTVKTGVMREIVRFKLKCIARI